MNNGPLITVLMPVYNCELYLKEAIDSVINQTFSDFEFLIINDGSTDGSEAIICSYHDKRIRLINQPNGGVSHALNEGLKLAKGKYIARFDADDICYLTRLKEQLDFMESNNDCVMVGSDADYVDESGAFVFSYQNTGHSHDEISEKIYQRNPLIHSTVFFIKSIILQKSLKSSFHAFLIGTRLVERSKNKNIQTFPNCNIDTKSKFFIV